MRRVAPFPRPPRPSACIALLLAAAAGWLSVTPVQAQHASAIRAAVVRARPALERSVETFVSKRSCVSCHHNSVALLTFAALDRHGMAVNPRVRAALEAKTLFELRRASAFDDAVQGGNLGDPTPNDSYLLMAAHAAGMAPDATLGVHARRISRWQRDGHWTTSDFRPPHSSGLFTATATAVRAIRLYMPPPLAHERDATVARATAWLAATAPISTEDASFRVMGLAWGGTSAAALAAASTDLRVRQLPSGAWPQLPGYRGDAYSTGQALVALREAGVPTSDDGWRRGIRFLLDTQAADGTWRTRTRMLSPATVSPPYFATGFPYGRDEYLSFTGSCWAVMALASALPDAPPRFPAPPPLASEARPPSWAQAAVTGSARDLQAALDAGLDPDSVTAGGTTLLMMVAHDADTVRLLLNRGATPATRSPSGVDALIVASGYGASAEAGRLLLDKGAQAVPPQGVRVRRAPLVFAAMAGDVETVGLLLSRGAHASGEAVSEAVTFGQTAAVRRFIDAKADASGEDSSGINLLHWATITNRPEAIPLLAAAGLSVDAVDGRGYTPLMYAASIDFGEMEALRALLAAGADTRATNEDGRTALDLARRYGHRQMAAALEPSRGTKVRAASRR